MKIRFGWQILFKLNPIEFLHVSLVIGFDEDVQFAISDAKQFPTICPDILRRCREPHQNFRIALRSDHIVLNRPFRR
jgi:hypothetical protein